MPAAGNAEKMSDRITGTHLRSENLNDNIKEKLKTFGEWAAEKGNFESVTNEIYKCGDKNGGKKLEPVLKALEYKVRNFHLVLAQGSSLLEAS